MADEKITFKITNEDGSISECEVLFTFESPETEKFYMVYTDHTRDAQGNLAVSAATLDPEKEPIELFPIETEREWEIVEEAVSQLHGRMQ